MPQDITPPGEAEYAKIASRLLDLQSAWDETTGEIAPAALQVVAQELGELGAVYLTYDDEDPDGTRHVNASGLISASSYLVRVLTGVIAQDAGVDRLTIINMTREVLDPPTA